MTGGCGINKARCALLTLQRDFSLLYLYLQLPPPCSSPAGGGADPPFTCKMRRLRAPKAFGSQFPADPTAPAVPCRALFLGVLGKKVKGRCGWASPSAVPAHRGLQQGGGILPAAVVMPRSRQMYSSPVQNTCSFMVLGQRQRPSRAGSRGSGLRCSQMSRVQPGRL